MKRSTNASKLGQIKSGGVTRKQIGGTTSQKILENKGGKITITETSKKKRNFVMNKSKLGTEKEQKLSIRK